MVVSNQWGGAGNGGTGVDWGIYLPPPEHVRTVHCGSSYPGLASGGRAEDGNALIQAMVGAARPGYPGGKGRTFSRVGGGGIGGRRRVGEGRMMGRG